MNNIWPEASKRTIKVLVYKPFDMSETHTQVHREKGGGVRGG